MSRSRANVIRIACAIIVIGAVVWWLKSRGDAKASRSGPRGAVAAATEGSGRGSARSDSGGAGRSGGDRVVPVHVAVAERVDLPVWLEGLGTVIAVQQVTVRAQVDGRLDKVLFTEGQPVKKGDVIAQIDPRPFRIKLLQAQGALARDRAQRDATRKNHERYKSLAAQNLVAAQQVDEIGGQLGQYEGAVKIDQASVEEALLQLDYAQVKAPIDGITGVRLVDAGNLVKANDTTGLVVITAIDPASVLFTVPQDKLSAIASALATGGAKVEVFNRDGTKKLAEGTLTVLDNQVNAQTSTLRLKASVPNPSRLLWPNAFVKARLLVETRAKALVVPAVAIQRGPEGTFVYIVGDDRTAVMKPVTVDLLTGDRAVIANGLAGGEQVVVEGQNQLRPGGRVEVIQPARGSAAGPTASKPAATP
jgi:multidrug efflux system membrane fusion protein